MLTNFKVVALSPQNTSAPRNCFVLYDVFSYVRARGQGHIILPQVFYETIQNNLPRKMKGREERKRRKGKGEEGTERKEVKKENKKGTGKR